MHLSLPLRPGPWALGLAVLLLIGCVAEDPMPDVEKGRYRARFEGDVSGTLTGPAVYQPQENDLIGIELGKQDGAGLSIEVGPRPLQTRTYEVVAAALLEGGRAADSLRGTFAFLSVRNAQFEATRGTLSVTHVGKMEVRGTFDFVMEGTARESPEQLSLRVKGDLRAMPQ